ncbi:uncharacterized protein [Miscanthus floridulus]
MKTFYRIRACGYPIPPPLVLEFNEDLLNGFEERFGQLLAWKGYPYGDPDTVSMERVWQRLEKKVVRDISRRVVSLASFKGYVRSFACTGLFIKLKRHGSKAARTVILTSATLVRSHDDDKIDNTLKAGIGGPLINFDGRFVGMNFYDGRGLTPFLPRQKIVEVISLVNDLPLEWGYGHSVPIPVRVRTKENRWPVPEPYWYHGGLDADRFHVPELRGRTLN